MLAGEDGPGEACKKEPDAKATDCVEGSVVIEASELSRVSRVQNVCDEPSAVLELLGHKGEPTGIEQIPEIPPEDQDVPEAVDRRGMQGFWAVTIGGKSRSALEST